MCGDQNGIQGATPDTGVLYGLKLATNTVTLLPMRGGVCVLSLNLGKLCDSSDQQTAAAAV